MESWRNRKTLILSRADMMGLLAQLGTNGQAGLGAQVVRKQPI